MSEPLRTSAGEGDELAQTLLEAAREAAGRAYCPYSNFPVGAAVAAGGRIFAGCNVENASYGLAMCAERVALFTAVAAGVGPPTELAVVCANVSRFSTPENRMPCGACRQVIAELMPPDARVHVGGVGTFTVAELLPRPFRL
jgi:cytidine deaminase